MPDADVVHAPKAGLASWLLKHRPLVVGVWLLALAVLAPRASRLNERLQATARIQGSESAKVVESLLTRFESPLAHSVILVATGAPPAATAEGSRVLRQIVDVVRRQPGVTLTASYLDQADPLFAGARSEGTFVVVGLDPGAAALETVIPPLIAATEGLARRLRASHPELTLRWTGEAPLNMDLRHNSSAEVRAAELRALPLTLGLLVLAFGALVASALPIAAGALAITLSLGGAAAVAAVWPMTVSLESIVSMLGLGLGVDFSLLTIARFREALVDGRDARGAAENAARTAGRTIWISSATVAVGFVGLLLVPLNELRSVAVGGLLVVLLSALIATTLLPVVLGSLGKGVDGGRILSRRGTREPAAAWSSWGRWVVRHPGIVLTLASAPVVLLAFQALRLNIELPRGDWLPQSMPSAVALRELRAMGRGGVVQALRVILEYPEDTLAVSGNGWAAARRLAEKLAEDPRVQQVRSLRSLAGERGDDLAFIAFLPGLVKRCYLSQEADAALLELIPREHVTPNELSRLVRELRAADAGPLTGLEGTSLKVGGLPAFNVDYTDAVTRHSTAVVGLVLAGTLLALLAGFRSLLIPLKALLLNLLSVTAAFGAVVLVFQDGFGASLLGLAGPTFGVFPAVPVLVFCIVFGLSMDYEVFLVSRVAESRRTHGDEAAALVEGLARTGGVITSAAAIMIAVFGAFTVGGSLLVKMLGFALAVAVLLDATVIRLAVCPALLRLAGRWNWWPGLSVSRSAPAVATALSETRP